ncbi:ATP-binding cassette domain-containing protein [Kitasatospora purpeofusca]|uniref:ATP-binding cassette domain-containing protein n=1 Tax=Kitasatospora purpeofusca TaxID=67352 RepID=UPI0036D333EC
MTADELDPLPGAWRSLGRSLRMGWRSSPAMIATAFCTEVLSAVPDAMFAWGLTAFATAVIAHSGTQIAAGCGLLAAMAAGNWLLETVSSRVNQRFADRAAVVVESHIAELQAGVATIEHHERPAQLDRISVLRDHASALSDLYRHLFTLIGVLLRAAITLGLLASVNPLLVLLGLLPLPTLLVSGRRAAAEKRVEEAGARHNRLARHLFLLATSAPAGKELRVARTGPLVRRLRHRAWEQGHRPLARARWVSTAWQAGAQALFAAAFIAALAYTAAHAANRTAAVLLVLAAGSRLSGYIGQTMTQLHFFRTIWLDCSRRLAWLEDYAAKHRAEAEWSAPERLAEGIRLDAVTFAYPGTDRPVLDGIDLLLPAGAVVAVVGENGAGKSSLVKLLCGLYPPTSGRITLDGQDLARTDPVSWRRRVTGTFQDFFAFEFRLRTSVGIGDLPRADDPEAVGTALERAGADDIARALPDGAETRLGAGWPQGVDLSHGQWQRVALARGFMREQPLLTVLDEPTSAVDAETEHALFDRYAVLARSGTRSGTGGVTLLVSHRFSTVRAADLILVLNGARVTEFGTHDQLIALGGHYAQLYGIQAEAYRTGLR